MLENVAPGFGDGLKGKWEAYRVETVGSRLIIAGSDERGTMFGLYAFIEKYLGVDPLYYWASRPPQPRATLAWDSVKISSGEPTFRFRGWFINDEDLLTEWKDGGGKRQIDYPYYGQVVNREVMRAVAEALVRSRFNLIIPASFVDILNPPEEALVQECARRGVFVSQHHVEPLGVSAFSYFNYWKKRGRDLKYSYFSHPAEVREVWRAYAEKWAAYPNVIWQLGLRGIADRPMWLADPNTPQSDADRGRLISAGDGGAGEDSGRGVSAPAALPLDHALGGRFGAEPARAAHDPGGNDRRLCGQLAGLEVATGFLLDAAQSEEHLRRLLPSRADRVRPAPGAGAVAAQDVRVPEDRRGKRCRDVCDLQRRQYPRVRAGH